MRLGSSAATRVAALAATALGALAASVALAATPARAAFSLPTLVSSSGLLQADYAYSPAISADGRYVVFVGSVDSVTGIYRKDLQSGEAGLLEVVARGEASAPSISADGRYVSFTTDENPANGAAGSEECSAVYVRDMDHGEIPGQLDAYEPGAFALASARDGSSESLLYKGSGQAKCPGGGSAAADRVALSADGRKVAFTVIGESNLLGPAGSATTPPDQIAVRDLDADSTTLVSATLASQESGVPQAVPLGAALAGNETPIETDGSHHPISASTAAISADGSTVAWMGVNIPEQAPVGPPAPKGVKEQYGYVEAKQVEHYAEPLWRRIADGPGAPVQRILAEDDKADPEQRGPLNFAWDPMDIQGVERGPLYGSYLDSIGFDNPTTYQNAEEAPTFATLTPQLSAGGDTVAVLSTAPAVGAEPVYPTTQPSSVPSNVYLVDMAAGLSRATAVRPLTAWAATNFGADPGATAPIGDLAISPDGTRVAFSTVRALFPLAPPELITPQVTTTSFAQLYEADMRSGTLALVSDGYEGGPAAGNVYTPSFDGAGNTLAFASSARNLVYGASNPGHSNVFAIETLVSPPGSGEQTIEALPADPLPPPAWRISATLRAGPAGSLVLDVVVPGAGSLNAVASAEAPLATSARKHPPARGGRARARASRAGAPTDARAHTTHSPPRTQASARIASARHACATAGLVELRLRPASRYGALVRSSHGLEVKILLSFSAAGRARLTDTLQARFRSAKPAAKTYSHGTAKRGHK